MSYSLIQLAPGAYDLYLADTIVASVVRSGFRQPYTWTAELLEDLPRGQRPSPFREIEHSFPSLEELCAWLGQPPVKTNNRQTASQGAREKSAPVAVLSENLARGAGVPRE